MAPALDHSLKLFNDLKPKVWIILLSIRWETLGSATIDNLVQVGYHGWSSLILRFVFHWPLVLNRDCQF